MARTARRGREPHENRVADHPVDLGRERIIFLSDGLFAIALTVLVVDLRVPELPTPASADQVSAALWAIDRIAPTEMRGHARHPDGAAGR